ncbi:MAG: hypothetical protein Ct9H90mP22_5990 [Gammaproteobacteria bacterium]|nr:MAG: hypothetical protein Ct9H90mP22_5990 [Gammaproteobacteria bacterium]
MEYPPFPATILSTESSISEIPFWNPFFLLAVKIAASLNKFAKSAPVKPEFFWEYFPKLAPFGVFCFLSEPQG